ncbi:amidohydrolase family protein [Actinomadura sp. 7K507]|uniref:amidohydrolase family protein n=1 Tax=Actinomadura sp. 7K507 TaxID=2530365 RepID=UPI001052B2A8|nr:amidohydrolase family protein [Actinomadura sp. 7K507]TDC98406.1 amidohydrolase [Actinomadura sp. 7K507]
MSQIRDETPGGGSAAEEHYIVVSTDSHVGPSVKEQLRDYCDSKYLKDFDRFVEGMEAHGLLSFRSSEAARPGEEETWSLGPSQAERFGKSAGIRNADQVSLRFLQRSYEQSLMPGLQDHPARLADMDKSGVAADVIFHGGLNGQSIPFSTTGLISWGDSTFNHLEPVGVRIYNRWLADFVSEAPERHAGIAHIPISDPEACVREVEWAAAAGLRGVNLPAPRGDFPMLNEPVWEPLWAACADAGLSLNTHGGGGEHYPYQGQGAQAIYMMETAWRTRRGVWVMILSGVFQRHPALKLVLTEQWMDWAPGVMADMDGLYTGSSGATLRAAMPKPPSEYFMENCYIGASFMANWEAKAGIEHDLALNVMWGDDYPHAEGTWPHTREAMQATFWDIDPAFTKQYIGNTAIDVYGLDPAKLEKVAARICPTVSELTTPATPPEGEVAGLYAFRAGPGSFV